MSNRLKMANIHAIIGLLEQDWSYWRIARELDVDRETVARYGIDPTVVSSDVFRQEKSCNSAADKLYYYIT